MRISPLATLLLSLSLAMALACGSESSIETDEGTVKVDRDDQTITFSAEGENAFEMKTGEDVELPESFPEDVPMYPNATLVSSMTSSEGVMVSSQSAADPEEVVAFYKEQLVGEGWTVEAEMNMGAQRMISFAKGDRVVTITTASEAGQTQIALMAGR